MLHPSTVEVDYDEAIDMTDLLQVDVHQPESRGIMLTINGAINSIATFVSRRLTHKHNVQPILKSYSKHHHATITNMVERHIIKKRSGTQIDAILEAELEANKETIVAQVLQMVRQTHNVIPYMYRKGSAKGKNNAPTEMVTPAKDMVKHVASGIPETTFSTESTRFVASSNISNMQSPHQTDVSILHLNSAENVDASEKDNSRAPLSRDRTVVLDTESDAPIAASEELPSKDDSMTPNDCLPVALASPQAPSSVDELRSIHLSGSTTKDKRARPQTQVDVWQIQARAIPLEHQVVVESTVSRKRPYSLVQPGYVDNGRRIKPRRWTPELEAFRQRFIGLIIALPEVDQLENDYLYVPQHLALPKADRSEDAFFAAEPVRTIPPAPRVSTVAGTNATSPQHGSPEAASTATQRPVPKMTEIPWSKEADMEDVPAAQTPTYALLDVNNEMDEDTELTVSSTPESHPSGLSDSTMSWESAATEDTDMTEVSHVEPSTTLDTLMSSHEEVKDEPMSDEAFINIESTIAHHNTFSFVPPATQSVLLNNAPNQEADLQPQVSALQPPVSVEPSTSSTPNIISSSGYTTVVSQAFNKALDATNSVEMSDSMPQVPLPIPGLGLRTTQTPSVPKDESRSSTQSEAGNSQAAPTTTKFVTPLYPNYKFDSPSRLNEGDETLAPRLSQDGKDYVIQNLDLISIGKSDAVDRHVRARVENLVYECMDRDTSQGYLKSNFQEPESVRNLLDAIERKDLAFEFTGKAFLNQDLSRTQITQHRSRLEFMAYGHEARFLSFIMCCIQNGLHPKDFFSRKSDMRNRVLDYEPELDNMRIDFDYAHARLRCEPGEPDFEYHEPSTRIKNAVEDFRVNGSLDILQEVMERWFEHAQERGADVFERRVADFEECIRDAGLTQGDHVAPYEELKTWLEGPQMGYDISTPENFERAAQLEKLASIIKVLAEYRWARSMARGFTETIDQARCDTEEDDE